MGFIIGGHRSPAIRAIEGIICEVDYDYKDRDPHLKAAYEIVCGPMRQVIAKDPRRVESYIQANSGTITPRIWVYSCMNNAAGDLVESGQYHLYRGLLSPIGNGLLAIFINTTQILVDLKSIDSEYAKEQIENIKKSIKMAG